MSINRDSLFARLSLQSFKADVFLMNRLRTLLQDSGYINVYRLSDDEVLDHIANLETASGASAQIGTPYPEPVWTDDAKDSELVSENVPSRSPQPRQALHQPCVFIFEYKPGMDAGEFARAVKMAEDEINRLKPVEFLGRLEKPIKRDTNEQKHARDLSIEQYKRAMPFLFEALRKEYPQLTAPEAAASLSREIGGSNFRRVAIEHRLDLVGGGTNKFAGLGDGRINSSLGSQLKARKNDLLQCAQDAFERGQATMNVRFTIRKRKV